MFFLVLMICLLFDVNLHSSIWFTDVTFLSSFRVFYFFTWMFHFASWLLNMLLNIFGLIFDETTYWAANSWVCFLQPILHFGDAYLSGMNHDLKSNWKFLLASKFRFFPLVGLKIKAINWMLLSFSWVVYFNCCEKES